MRQVLLCVIFCLGVFLTGSGVSFAAGEKGEKNSKIEAAAAADNTLNETDIRDIRGPKSFANRIWRYILIVVAVLLITGGIFALILWKKNKVESKALPAPAHLIAYEALAALGKKDYIHQGKIKAYYIELSDIVRHYLENRFNLRAPEMTTEEFLIKVKEDSNLSLEHKDLLRDFLTNCDLVKFAKYQPAETEADLALASARRLVDQTKQEDKS